MPENLSQSQEDYLEAIYNIAGEKGVVRVRDIANEKSVSMPSVNGAMKRLVKQGLIKHNRYEYVELTKKGRTYAERVAGRHVAIKTFLTEVLGVDDKVADLDACSIEHCVSETTIEKLVDFLNERKS
jgi:DtxR family Mn-dependent transcriptional regulator